MIHRDEIVNNCRYITSKVIERDTPTKIKTKKRFYVLVGKLSVKDAEKYGTPRFIIDSFMVSSLITKKFKFNNAMIIPTPVY